MTILSRVRILSYPSRRILLISFVILAFWAAPAGRAEESENPPSFTFGVEADFNSRFLWRGMALSRGMVLQPAAYLAFHSLAVEVWNNIELEPLTGERHHNETDLTTSYNKEWRSFGFEPSFQMYLFPRDVECPNTAEAALKISHPLGPIGVFTRHVFDVAAYPGAYFGEAGIEWQRKFGRRLDLSAAASAGWAGAQFNGAYLGVRQGALNLVSLEVALSWQAAKNLQVRPHLNLSTLANRRLRKSVSEPDVQSLGVTLCAEF